MSASPNNDVLATDAHDPIKGSDLDKDSMEAPQLQRRSADVGTAAASGWAFGRMFGPASHRSDGAAQQQGSEVGGTPGWAMGRMFRPASHRSTEAGASQEGGHHHGGAAAIWAGGRLYRPGSHRSVCSVMSMESEHVTRLAQHELELLEEVGAASLYWFLPCSRWLKPAPAAGWRRWLSSTAATSSEMLPLREGG